MRRILAIALTAVFGWMFVAPLLPALLPSAFGAASVDEDGLPACCRREGRHHCMMAAAMTAQMERESQSRSRHFGLLEEKCPYQKQHSTAAVQPFSFYAAPRWTAEALVQRPGLVSQVEASYRIAASHNPHKRGPPSSL